METKLNALSLDLASASAVVMEKTIVVFNAQAKLTQAKDALVVAGIEWKTLGSNDDQRRTALIVMAGALNGQRHVPQAQDVLDAQAALDGAQVDLTVATHYLDDRRAQLRVLEAILKVRNLADVRKAGK